MDSLSLREHLPFLLQGLSDEEKAGFLTALKPLTLDPSQGADPALGPTYQTKQDFIEAFYAKLDWTGKLKYYGKAFDKVIANVNTFFTDVTSCAEMGNDTLYFLKKGADVLVNYAEDSNLSTPALFDAVQFSYETDNEDGLSEWTEGLVGITKLDFEASQIPQNWLDVMNSEELIATMNTLDKTNLSQDPKFEALRWYYSTDLAWMNGAERLAVITESFDPAIVKEKKKKWDSYANQPEFQKHRTHAQRHLNEIDPQHAPQTRFKTFFGDTRHTEKNILDAISIVITVESKGDEKAPTNHSKDGCRNFYGLMQVCGDHFVDKRYKSDNFTGSNFNDPQANIETGVNYLVKYCMRQSVNSNKSFSRALALYNGLTSETPNYIRDYIIYSRFLGREIL